MTRIYLGKRKSSVKTLATPPNQINKFSKSGRVNSTQNKLFRHGPPENAKNATDSSDATNKLLLRKEMMPKQHSFKKYNKGTQNGHRYG